MVFGDTKKAILFKEPNQDRILPASNDKELAKSCLLVLRERYENPAWGYKPKRVSDFSKEEEDFITFWEKEAKFLPRSFYIILVNAFILALWNNQGITTKKKLYGIRNVTELLKLSESAAVDYKVIQNGRYIPTAYYLLSRRKHYPNEDFILVQIKQN